MKPAIRITKPVSPVLALLCISLCLAAFGQETKTFDLRHPQPLDFPHERSSGATSVQFTSYSYDQNFPYDTTASFGADDVTPFEVQSVSVDGRKVDAFQVYNRSINNFLCRANGVQDLTVRFVSNWETGKEVKVEVRGANPAGGAVQLAVAGTTPEKRAVNSLAFQHPAVSFPYFHITCSFLAKSYTPFTIESVTLNGEPAFNYRMLQGRGGGNKPEQIRAREANDGAISSDDGFTIEIPRMWQSDDELKVVVSGKTASGETQELEASGKASWTSAGREGWSHAASLVLHETVGVARQGEPVEVTLGLLQSRVTDPEREIRVVTRIPEHPQADGAGYVEFPCQILDVTTWNDRSLIDGGEKDAETGEVLADLDNKDQSFVAAKGGRGGRGNARFVSSTNRIPRRADPGEKGTERWFKLELKVIADVGIIGFPSVGKSSLIRALSNANPKVAAYPFTTLSPHLGTIMTDEFKQVIFADIPGLIQGAHEGHGLGHKFLRHIERTRMLIHLVDLDPDTGRDPYQDFMSINEELKNYNPDLLNKEQVVAGNKIDLPGAEERFKELSKKLAENNVQIVAISAKDRIETDRLLDDVLVRLDLLEGRTPGKKEWEGP